VEEWEALPWHVQRLYLEGIATERAGLAGISGPPGEQDAAATDDPAAWGLTVQ
jgi:hypothetical protein